MPRPFTLLEAVDTPDGRLTLHRRGDRDFMISIDGRVLMTTGRDRSERALAELGCAAIRHAAAPRVLIGGLGLGLTLRAALDALPSEAQVVVSELNDAVVRWCRGPAACLTDGAVDDRRVEVRVTDVAEEIRAAAGCGDLDAILLDLYVGPGDAAHEDHPLYGRAILEQAHASLRPAGVFAVWGEDRSPVFKRRLRSVGFDVAVERPRGGGPRHVIHLATRR
jgi:spermidine synthase